MAIAVVGPATADALLERGIAVDVVPEKFAAEAVLEALRARGDLAGVRVLYPAAEGARPVLFDGLRDSGATVDYIPIYRSVYESAAADALRETVAGGGLDLVVFASGAAVRGFVEALGVERAARLPAVTIGPITSGAARAAGMTVIGEAPDSTIDELVAEVLRAGRRLRSGETGVTGSTVTSARGERMETAAVVIESTNSFD
jgi:uroporphyrinogen III methyltransferase/synthase